MRNLVLEKSNTYDFSEETLSQMVNLIKLCFNKLNNYEAFNITVQYKDHIVKTYWKFYGVEWEKSGKCPKIM